MKHSTLCLGPAVALLALAGPVGAASRRERLLENKNLRPMPTAPPSSDVLLLPQPIIEHNSDLEQDLPPTPTAKPSSDALQLPLPLVGHNNVVEVVANDDKVTIASDTEKVFVEVLENDVGSPDLEVTSIVRQASHGYCAISSNKKRVVYMPDKGYVGKDRCKYKACDEAMWQGDGHELVENCDVAWVRITIKETASPTASPSYLPTFVATEDEGTEVTTPPTPVPPPRPTYAPSKSPITDFPTPQTGTEKTIAPTPQTGTEKTITPTYNPTEYGDEYEEEYLKHYPSDKSRSSKGSKSSSSKSSKSSSSSSSSGYSKYSHSSGKSRKNLRRG